MADFLSGNRPFSFSDTLHNFVVKLLEQRPEFDQPRDKRERALRKRSCFSSGRPVGLRGMSNMLVPGRDMATRYLTESIRAYCRDY